MALFILPDYSFYEATATKRKPAKCCIPFGAATENLTQYSKPPKKIEKRGKIKKGKPKSSAARAIKMHFYEQNYQQA